ncbi:MAG: hypothetical protein Q7U64_04680, partial [Desulfocapsaceae bacterium]|nr:hypothetical protein [Desulfocapsaceae bacterium]
YRSCRNTSSIFGKIYKSSVATAQLLGVGHKQKVALAESISCVAVAGHVAARILSIKEVGGNGFTFVAKEVASLRVRVAQLRYHATQLRNYYKFPLCPVLKKRASLPQMSITNG